MWILNWYRGSEEGQLKNVIAERDTIADDYRLLTEKEHFLEIIKKGETKSRFSQFTQIH